MGILNKRSNLKAIPPKRLDIMRLKDANRASLSQVTWESQT